MPAVFQLKVTLLDIEPAIWRRIVVRGDSTWWALHVAIQDAMGWFDCHLHQFFLDGPDGPSLSIGLPDPDDPECPIQPGQERPLSQDLKAAGDRFRYLYDFGDDWEHEVLVEKVGILPESRRLPVCLDGQRGCPPEDCGGPHGYAKLLETLAGPDNRDKQELQAWLSEAAPDFAPEDFNPREVRFQDPQERLEKNLDPDLESLLGPQFAEIMAGLEDPDFDINEDDFEEWRGRLISLQLRANLLRVGSDRHATHAGYRALIEGTRENREGLFTVALNDRTVHEMEIRPGDTLEGLGEVVRDLKIQGVDLIESGGLNVLARGREEQHEPPPWKHTPPPPEEFEERGYRRLATRTYNRLCKECTWGLRMPTVIESAEGKVLRKRFETFCCGPEDCPVYQPGPTRKVPLGNGETWEEI